MKPIPFYYPRELLPEPVSKMPPKRGNIKADPIGANPEAKKLLTKLIATGTIPESAKAADWYYRRPHAAVFRSVNIDKFRPYFKRLLNKKYVKGPASASKLHYLSIVSELQPPYRFDCDISGFGLCISPFCLKLPINMIFIFITSMSIH